MDISEKYSLNKQQEDQFARYADLLIEWNEKFNLTAIVDKQDIYLKHFDDCLALTALNLQGKLLDIGSGAGFPGLVLKIYYPDLEVTLLEPNNKKVTFLNEVIAQLNLQKIEVVNQRAEEFIVNNYEAYDYVTARAVSQLNILLELAIPYLKVNGHFLAMKGPKAQQEIDEIKNGLGKLNCHVEKTYSSILEDNTRITIDIVKDQKTDHKYPRNYSQIKKKPL